MKKRVKPGDPEWVDKRPRLVRIIAAYVKTRDIAEAALVSGCTELEVVAGLKSDEGRRLLEKAEADRLAEKYDAEAIKRDLRELARDPRQRGSARVKALELLGKTEGLWGGQKETGAPTAMAKLSGEELDRWLFNGLQRVAERVKLARQEQNPVPALPPAPEKKEELIP